MQDRNQAVIDELNDLKQGNTAIEELARTELGLIREDETFFRILGDK
ncbi:septum formation initiator family protein [Succinatimonas hippei]